jgi:hypothetical protein
MTERREPTTFDFRLAPKIRAAVEIVADRETISASANRAKGSTTCETYPNIATQRKRRRSARPTHCIMADHEMRS